MRHGIREAIRRLDPPPQFSIYIPPGSPTPGTNELYLPTHDRDGRSLRRSEQIHRGGIFCHTPDGRTIVVQVLPPQYDRQRI